MDASCNSDAIGANYAEIIDDLAYLGYASGGPKLAATCKPNPADPITENTASVQGSSRESTYIQPLKGLSKLVSGIGVSGCRGGTENAGYSGLVTKPKTQIKRNAIADNHPKASRQAVGSVDVEFIPQTPERKRARLTFTTLADVHVDGNAVPDVDDVESWGDGLIESWDACELYAAPEETQHTVPSSKNVEAVVEIDHDELPSNQEAFKRESYVNIDVPGLTGLIQDTIKTALDGLEQWFSTGGARPPGGARTLSRGGASRLQDGRGKK